MRTSEVLNTAADEIQRKGWKQFDGWDPRGTGLCLEGGIIAAMGMSVSEYGNPPDNFTQCPAYRSVREYLVGKRELLPGGYAFMWNDRSERTENEVIEVLRATALIEEAKENTSIEKKEEVSA